MLGSLLMMEYSIVLMANVDEESEGKSIISDVTIYFIVDLIQ